MAESVSMTSFLASMSPQVSITLLVTTVVLVILTSLAISQFNNGTYNGSDEQRQQAISVNNFEIVMLAFSVAALVLAIIAIVLQYRAGRLTLYGPTQ
jgi:hypothetical protein